VTSGDTYVTSAEMARGLEMVQVETKVCEVHLYLLTSERQQRIGDIETLILRLGHT